jgi:hypothetical protein
MYKWSRYSTNGYEVSSHGDKRFSAFFAYLKDGRNIETAYQLDVKGYRALGDDWELGKGNPPLRALSKDDVWEEYKELWKTYIDENPKIFEDLAELCKDKTLTDKFAATDISQARALCELLNEKYYPNYKSKELF